MFKCKNVRSSDFICMYVCMLNECTHLPVKCILFNLFMYSFSKIKNLRKCFALHLLSTEICSASLNKNKLMMQRKNWWYVQVLKKT